MIGMRKFMKKKIIAVFLAALTAFQLTGCTQLITRQIMEKQPDSETAVGTVKEGGEQDTEGSTAEDGKQDSAVGITEEGASDGESSSEVRYQDDYYEYVNENILNEIELGATDAHWDWFSELSAYVSEEMSDITRDLVNDENVYPKGSSEQKIKDLYECVSNIENRNKTGLGGLQEYMDAIRSAKTIDEYVMALAKLSGDYGFSSIIGGYTVMQDRADSSKYAVYMMYADTLIGKEYIENQNAGEYVDLYLDYICDMLTEFGMSGSEAAKSADDIETLLRDICASTLSAEQLYDPAITYNTYTEEQLQKLYTNVDVDDMLRALRIDGQDKYIVMDVGQAEKINSLLVEENLQALKDYSTFVLLNDTAEYSSQNYARLKEDMDNALYGITQRWDEERVYMNMTQDLLPWDFGEIYVDRHFSEKDKKNVEDMIELILDEYEDIIMRQTWLSDATKRKAVRKLETMQVKIGYPDEWPAAKDMMQVVPVSEGGSLMSNMLTSMQVAIDDSLSRLGEEVDRSEWNVTPQTINAYYSPQNNEIVFPAAILQNPFYSGRRSDAANLGGIGYIIAHEVSHAFDSSGSLYDEYGNYNVWWTDEEREEYERLTQSIIDYYNGYEIMGIAVDGELTLMENIADLGAVTCIAAIIGDDGDALDEAFGQMAYNWASEDTASYMMYLINTDTHAPNKIRVNAVLSSCDAFYEIYDISESDGMYVAPEDRVGIWR